MNCNKKTANPKAGRALRRMLSVAALMLCMLLLFTACGAPAATSSDQNGECGDGMTYTYNATTKKLTITGEGSMKDYASAAEVPWYAYRTEIEKIAIDEGVKHIGDFAFYYCINLQDIGIASTVLSSIGKNAFWMCQKIDEIKLPDTISEIGENGFAYCAQLELFTVTNLSKLGTGAFMGCSNLRSVSIGGTIAEIPSQAFMNCTALKSIAYPETVTADVEALKQSDAFKNVFVNSLEFAVVKESAVLTVECIVKDGDGETVLDTKVLGTYKKGESVTVEPPVIEGYTLSDGEKTQTIEMPGMDYTVKFVYKANAVEETTDTSAPEETTTAPGSTTEEPEEKTPVVFLVVLIVLVVAIAVGAVLLVRSSNNITKDSQTVRKNGDDKNRKSKNNKKK